jgi:hypothetical protein
MALDLISWALGAHGVILPLSFVALYRYSDRSDLFAKAVGDMEGLSDRMRAGITAALEDELNPVFERAEGEPRTVTMVGYSERPTNPVGSDKYRQALRRFIDGNARALIDYVCVYHAKNTWCRWARFLGWAVLSLAFWQVVCVAILGIAGKLIMLQIPETAVKLSFLPSTLLIVLFFLCQGVLLRQHDIIYESKNQNPSF